jgi:hypothetical protein
MALKSLSVRELCCLLCVTSDNRPSVLGPHFLKSIFVSTVSRRLTPSPMSPPEVGGPSLCQI